MTTYTWGRGGVLLADGAPCGVLDKSWKRSAATFESAGVTWDFAWGEKRRRELRLGETVLAEATNTSMLRTRWRFEGELVCEATPKRPLSHAITLRDARGRLGTIAEPRVLMTGVKLRLERDVAPHLAAFALWVLESEARGRFNVLDLAAGASS